MEFKNLCTSSQSSIVLGQPDFYSSSSNNGGASGQSLSGPATFCTDGNMLAVPDQGNNRVLIWQTFPTVTHQPADIVLGQPTMSSILINAGLGAGNPTAQTLRSPDWCTIVNGHFIVADGANQRVLIWNTIPTVTQQAADIELGEPNMFTNTGGTTSQLFTAAYAVYSSGSNLFVADYSNSRVLGWNTLPSISQQPADFVLGQSTLNVGGAHSGANGLQGPQGILIANGRLFIADRNNNRVLIWNTIPSINQQPADLVLGQPSMASIGINAGAGAGNASAQSMYQPVDINFDGARLFVTDINNNRILVYNTLPTMTNQAADFVLGQPSFSSVSANQGGGRARWSFQHPTGFSIMTTLLVSGVRPDINVGPHLKLNYYPMPNNPFYFQQD